MKHDMLDAIWKTARLFRELNLEPPVVTLASHDDGMRFLTETGDYHGYERHRSNGPTEAVVHVRGPMPPISALPNGDAVSETSVTTLPLPHYGTFIDGKEPLMEVQWMGVKVRWPAKLMHLPGGRSLWY